MRSRRALPVIASVALALAAAARAGEDAPARHALDDAPAVLARLVPHVEAACGAAFPAPPVVRELSARAAAAAFRGDLRDEVARRHPQLSDAQRETLLTAAASGSVASCLARYSFSERAIVLVRDSFDAQRAAAGFAADESADLLAAVLAHEAVHALDDARFDLRTLYAGARDEEALRARAMLVEGRAVHFGRVAAQAAGVPAGARELLPGGAEPPDVHAWTLRLTYELGARHVADVVARGGRVASEAELRSPPDLTLPLCAAGAAAADARPGDVLRRAGLGDGATPLSALLLRARHAALRGRERADALFEPYRGGAQTLVDATNAAVLAFADEAGARAYCEAAGDEAPTERRGSLVLRAYGPAAETLLPRLVAAAEAPPR